MTIVTVPIPTIANICKNNTVTVPMHIKKSNISN